MYPSAGPTSRRMDEPPPVSDGDPLRVDNELNRFNQLLGLAVDEVGTLLSGTCCAVWFWVAMK